MSYVRPLEDSYNLSGSFGGAKGQHLGLNNRLEELPEDAKTIFNQEVLKIGVANITKLLTGHHTWQREAKFNLALRLI
jgi:hypothetical protein